VLLFSFLKFPLKNLVRFLPSTLPLKRWIIHLDEEGTLLQERSYGGPKEDTIRALLSPTPNSFTFVGDTFSFGKKINDIWRVHAEDSLFFPTLERETATQWYENFITPQETDATPLDSFAENRLGTGIDQPTEAHIESQTGEN